MSKRQTRKSISVRGTTYRKLRALGKRDSVSMSDLVEKALAPLLVGVTEDPDPPVNRVDQIRAVAQRRAP